MAAAELNTTAAQLGMSPWARSRLVTLVAPADDPLGLLLAAWDEDAEMR